MNELNFFALSFAYISTFFLLYFFQDIFSRAVIYFLLIPMMSAFAWGGGTISLLLTTVFLLGFQIGIRLINIYFSPNFKLNSVSFFWIILMPVLLIFFQFRYLIDLNSLTDIYGQRENYKSSVSSSALLPYVKGIAKVILVTLTAYTLVNKKYILYAAIIALIFFGIFSSKYMLFLPVIVLGTYYFLTNSNFVLFISIFAISLSAILIHYQQDFILTSIIRRGLYLNIILIESYHNLFLNHGPQLYLNDALSFLSLGRLDVVYEAGLPIYGDTESHANTGAVGASIIQLGYIGPLIYGLFYGLFFTLLRIKDSGHGPNKIIITYLTIQAILISDIVPTLLMHGGIIFLLFLRLYSEKEIKFNR